MVVSSWPDGQLKYPFRLHVTLAILPGKSDICTYPKQSRYMTWYENATERHKEKVPRRRN